MLIVKDLVMAAVISAFLSMDLIMDREMGVYNTFCLFGVFQLLTGPSCQWQRVFT